MDKKAKNERIKIVFLDVDGTLFDNQNQKVWPSTIVGLKKLKMDNIQIAIATGRARFMLESIEEILPLVDYFVLINGQLVENAQGDILYENPLKTTQITALINDFKKHHAAYGFEGRRAIAVSVINENVLKSFKGLALRVPPIQPDFYLNQSVYQMWAFCSKDTIDEIANHHPQLQFLQWMDIGYDVLPKECSKAKGIEVVLSHLGYNKEQAMAIGDASNDLEMIEFVGLGVAMGNACEEVKKAAKHITKNVDEEGVYDALISLNIIS